MPEASIVILDAAAGSSTPGAGARLAAEASLEHREPTGDPASLAGFDVGIVLDGASLALARSAHIPTVVALLPRFDARFDGDLAGVERVLVAHPQIALELSRRGIESGRISVVGPVPPPGYEPAADREAAQRAHGLGGGPVVGIAASLLADHGGSLLVQLALASDVLRLLFDVGLDVEAADSLRRLVPAHGLEARIFARGPDAPSYWQLADVALVGSRELEATLALGVGAPLLLLDESPTSRLLEAAGIASRASLTTLSIELDAAHGPVLERAREAVRQLDIAGCTARVIEEALDAHRRRTERALPRGLPEGLERVGAPARSSRPPAIEPEGRPPGTPTPAAPPDEPNVEEELAALKAKYGA